MSACDADAHSCDTHSNAQFVILQQRVYHPPTGAFASSSIEVQLWDEHLCGRFTIGDDVECGGVLMARDNGEADDKKRMIYMVAQHMERQHKVEAISKNEEQWFRAIINAVWNRRKERIASHVAIGRQCDDVR